MAASQTTTLQANDHIQGLAGSARRSFIAQSSLLADEYPRSQHDDEDHAIGADLPVRRDMHEGQKWRCRQRERQRADDCANWGHTPANEFTPAEDHAGDREQGVAIADIGVR